MSKESALAKAQSTTTPSVAAPAPVAPTKPTEIPVAAAPTPAATPEPVKPSTNDERLAHFAKKEAALQKERETIKAEKASMAAERAKYEDVGKKYKEFETMKEKDPIAAMRHAGFTDTDIFNFYVKAQEDQKLKETPEGKATAAALAEVQKLKDELKTKEDTQKAAQDAATIRRFQGKISNTVTTNKEKYEYCNYYGAEAEQLIFATVEEVLKDTGEVLSPQEASDMVEKFYEDRDKSMGSIKKRSGPVSAAPEPVAPEPAKPMSKTLTNKVAPTVASSAPKKETQTEKRERLIKQIQEGGLRK